VLIGILSSEVLYLISLTNRSYSVSDRNWARIGFFQMSISYIIIWFSIYDNSILLLVILYKNTRIEYTQTSQIYHNEIIEIPQREGTSGIVGMKCFGKQKRFKTRLKITSVLTRVHSIYFALSNPRARLHCYNNAVF
jgi:hypothetical protein